MADRAAECSSWDVPAKSISGANSPQKVVYPRCGVLESYVDFQRPVDHQASAYASEEI